MEPFIAQILMFAGNFAPRGWAFCNGDLLSIDSNQALFSILGTTYGGDGRTTFGLPELRGRVPVHSGGGGGGSAGPGLTVRPLGQKSGSETHSLTTSELPSHNHSISLHAEKGLPTTSDPDGNMISQHTAAGSGFKPYNADEDKAMATQAIRQVDVGNNTAHNIMQPFLVINFIIALQGTYPSRN